MGLKADLDRAAWFVIRWAAASLWVGFTFLIAGLMYAFLPESWVQGNGWLILLGWGISAYIGAHYGIWHR